MAKRRKSNGKKRAERDNTLSLGSLLRPSVPFRPLSPVSPDLFGERLTEIEDRRTFHPLREFRPPAVLLGATRASLVPAVSPARKAKKEGGLRHRQAPPPTLAFRAPKEVLVCVRRHRRREVLHALKKTGRGARARHRHRNPYSEIRC